MDLEFSCNDKIHLVEDLADHGMLDDTLVIWGGEFVRTNYCQGLYKPGADFGRDHHPRCFTSWMAGGGIRPGISWGKPMSMDAIFNQKLYTYMISMQHFFTYSESTMND